MKKRYFIILVLFSSMMMGCAAQNTSINAFDDESDAFGVIENTTVEENSEQEVLSTQVLFEKELKETDNSRIAELLNVSGIHFDGFNQDHYHSRFLSLMQILKVLKR